MSPRIVFNNWRPTGPKDGRSGLRMELLVTGEIEEFLFNGACWSRKVQISELPRRRVRANGAELRADGSVKLLHDGSILPTGKRFSLHDSARQKSFVLTGSSPQVFRIEYQRGHYWEYIYLNKQWHRVLPETPAKGREFLPPTQKKGGDDGILTPVPVATPESGVLQLGPLTLYANGSIEFGDTLYRTKNAIPYHEHLGFVAERRSGRRQMMTIKRVGRTVTDDELPLMLRFEWGAWRRYVRCRGTFRARFAHHFREATLPLKRVMERVVLTMLYACSWLIMTSHLLLWVFVVVLLLDGLFS